MMLSICLHIGNINIVAEGQGSGVTNKDELGKTAEMFQVKADELLTAITNRTMGGGRIETFLKPLEPKQADKGSQETVDVVVPAAGESVTEADVGEWFVKVGDSVKEEILTTEEMTAILIQIEMQ